MCYLTVLLFRLLIVGSLVKEYEIPIYLQQKWKETFPGNLNWVSKSNGKCFHLPPYFKPNDWVGFFLA